MFFFFHLVVHLNTTSVPTVINPNCQCTSCPICPACQTCPSSATCPSCPLCPTCHPLLEITTRATTPTTKAPITASVQTTPTTKAPTTAGVLTIPTTKAPIPACVQCAALANPVVKDVIKGIVVEAGIYILKYTAEQIAEMIKKCDHKTMEKAVRDIKAQIKDIKDRLKRLNNVKKTIGDEIKNCEKVKIPKLLEVYEEILRAIVEYETKLRTLKKQLIDLQDKLWDCVAKGIVLSSNPLLLQF